MTCHEISNYYNLGGHLKSSHNHVPKLLYSHVRCNDRLWNCKSFFTLATFYFCNKSYWTLDIEQLKKVSQCYYSFWFRPRKLIQSFFHYNISLEYLMNCPGTKTYVTCLWQDCAHYMHCDYMWRSFAITINLKRNDKD